MKYIDLSAAVREHFPRFANISPKFVLRFMEWVICQDKLNVILNKYSHLEGTDFHIKVIEELKIKVEIEGLENLPDKSQCFFASNHPFGIIDGMILTKIVGEKYGDFKAIGNDAFMLIPSLRAHIATVNVYGQSSKQSVTELQKLYDSEIAITHFPAGEVSRLYYGKVQDKKWHKSFISKAISSKRDIVPFYFYGSNSVLFHCISLLRRIFFIKANIELILLPREFFKKYGKTIKVKIGKPISYSQFDSTQTHFQWAQKVRNYVYSFRNKNINQISF
jgi:putative hemolysin